MLHDPSHKPVIPEEKEIQLCQKDKDVLKKLGAQIAEISQDKINDVNRKNWTLLNDKQSVKPMVWINEVPWHEMNVDEELTLCCTHPWARNLEDELRKTIYQWNHFRGDMVVNPFISCPLAIHSTDFGIIEDVDIARTDADNDIYSRHFKIQIKEPEDIEKIKMPVITHYEKATEYSYQAMKDVFEGIIPVKKVGQTHIWYTPWDFLVRWWGVQEAIMDLIMRPEMVHDIYERMVQAWMVELDQFEQLNLLSLDCNNTRVGSGGYGYTTELPGKDFQPDHVLAKNMWGCANAQIFSTVSPEMHWEFAVEHDLKWLNRFGLTYYGCCEPLDQKIHILRKIKNLRKISVSPWNDSKKIIDAIGSDYVMSRKPNPAVVAMDSFSPELAEKEIREFMDLTDDSMHVELIFKDISTVRHDPRRLWEWESIAMKTAEDYAK
jgi:hypothetical protein